MMQTSTLRSHPRKYRVVLPIALAVFLLALSPIFLSAANASSVSPVEKLTSFSYTHNFPHPSAKLPAGAAKGCPSSTQCVYVADSIGGVQVFEGSTLLTSIPVPLTSSDPQSCPVSAYYAYGKILLADPRGNFGAGEIRVLNPATNGWEAPITSSGGAPAFMVLNQKNNWLYITNFGYGSVTVINSAGVVEGVINTCGALPEFLDYDSVSGLVFVGNRENIHTDTGCVDVINGLTAETPILHSYPVIDLLTVTGVAVNQATGNVYINDAFQNNEQGVVYEYSSTGKFIQGIAPPTGSFELWGSVYDPEAKAVYVTSPDTLNLTTGILSEQGFAFYITSGNSVSGRAFLGLGPEAGCYDPAVVSVFFPNFQNIVGSAVSIVTTIPGIISNHVTNVNYVGVVEGFGCAAS